MSKIGFPIIVRQGKAPHAILFTPPVTMTSNDGAYAEGAAGSGASTYGYSMATLEASLGEISKRAWKKQADSGTAVGVAVSRETKAHFNTKFSARFFEADATLPFKFKVILIKEGLGNLATRYYYTKDALKSAPPFFEGKKCFANHPSATEESDRPERDVRDVIGHFENVVYEEDEGRGQLVAMLQMLPDDTVAWAKARLAAAIEYSKKYPDREFVGLSINADGESERMAIKDIKSKVLVPPAAMEKLNEAVNMGLTDLNLVTVITGARSCDLVTDPGAGGKIVSAER